MESGLKLLPCPFCGGEASPDGSVHYSTRHEDTWRDGTPVREAYFCNCIRCGGRGMGEFQTRDDAVTAWNTRAPSDAALVEALEAVRDYRISANPTAPDAHHDLVLLQHVGRLRTIAIVALAAAKGQQP